MGGWEEEAEPKAIPLELETPKRALGSWSV